MKNEVCPVVTLKMSNSNEKLNSSAMQEYFHAVTLENSVLSDDLVTIILSESRPKMQKTTMEIPLSELTDYNSGKSVLFEGGEEWSLGDEMCYYLVFN